MSIHYLSAFPPESVVRAWSVSFQFLKSALKTIEEKTTMLFILEDDVSASLHHIEIEVNKSSTLTAEQLLLEFVKFRNIKNPGTNINVKDLCLCSVVGSGKKKVEKQLLHSSLIEVLVKKKKKGVGSGAGAGCETDSRTRQLRVYGLGGQLAQHQQAVDQLRGFNTLVNTLGADINHFISNSDGGRLIGAKRYNEYVVQRSVYRFMHECASSLMTPSSLTSL